jgi:hypothetical protein
MNIDEETTILFRDLFLEVAIVEHLVRSRADKLPKLQLPVGQLGVLTYFERNACESEQEDMLAWSFQDADDVMAAKVDALVALGHLISEGERPKRKLTITPSGQLARLAAFQMVRDEIAPLTEGVDPADAKTALNVLRELRRTMDNMPDR